MGLVDHHSTVQTYLKGNWVNVTTRSGRTLHLGIGPLLYRKEGVTDDAIDMMDLMLETPVHRNAAQAALVEIFHTPKRNVRQRMAMDLSQSPAKAPRISSPFPQAVFPVGSKLGPFPALDGPAGGLNGALAPTSLSLPHSPSFAPDLSSFLFASPLQLFGPSADPSLSDNLSSPKTPTVSTLSLEEPVLLAQLPPAFPIGIKAPRGKDMPSPASDELEAAIQQSIYQYPNPDDTKWPLDYACDMAVSFLEICKKHQSVDFPAAFTVAFPEYPWVPPTWGKNFAVWKCVSDELRVRLIEHGRTPEGRWTKVKNEPSVVQALALRRFANGRGVPKPPKAKRINKKKHVL